MHKEDFAKKWNQLKGKIQEKWGRFTRDDLNHINGNYELFLGQLQKKYSYSKEQAEQELNRWCESCQKECSSNKTTSSSKCHDMPKGSCHGKDSTCKSPDKNKNTKHDKHQGHNEKHRKVS